jgi:CheY-like chemotaxis protein
MRILVVEDDLMVADAIRRGLSMAGFAVDCATDADQATIALGAEHFDLTILDIGLPGTDGLTLLRRLRNSGSHLPVMILTARETLAAQALDLGADDFVVKPFEQTELAARCRALIRRSHLNSSGQLTLGQIRIDITGRQLHVDGERIELTSRECLGPELWPDRDQGAVAAGRRKLGSGDITERGRGTRLPRASQIGRFCRTARGARTGSSPRGAPLNERLRKNSRTVTGTILTAQECWGRR